MPIPSDASPLPAGTAVGQYTLVRLLGRGGMGEVYLAHDPRLDRDVALKLLPAEAAGESRPPPAPGSAEARTADDRRARFQREARAAAALNHPNICTIHEVGEADGRAYIAMEYLEGANLSECLTTGPSPMPVAEVLDIAGQIADALEAAHARQIVHRDLKSANIVLLPRGQVKVLDFGLAKRLPGAEAPGLHSSRGPGLHAQSTALPDRPPATTYLATEAGLVVGTAAYMAPEQALGQPVDARSDLSSFGVVLYELLTGRLPFTGRTPMELLNAVVNATPPPIPRYNDEVPDALVAVVTKLLAKDPAARYQSAREVLADLKRLRAPSAGPAPAWTDARPAWWRRPRAMAAAALVVAAVAAGVVFWPRAPAPGGPGDDTISLVVLPAQVFGPSVEHLADAVPATLSTFLASVEGLETKVPPNSVETRKLDDDAERIAALYEVDHYVRAMVFAEGAALRLNLQLVARSTRSLRWSQEFTGTSAEYLTLIRQAAEGLRTHLRPASSALPARLAETTNSEALLALETGVHRANRYNYEHDLADFEAAEKALLRAIELEPKLARAAAALGDLLIFKSETGATVPVDDIIRWGTLATEWDPNSAEGWSVLAYAAVLDAPPRGGQRRAAELAFRAATAGPRVALAQFALNATNLPVALQAASAARAAELDPLYPYPSYVVAFQLGLLERTGEALRMVDRALEIEPGLPSALAARTWLLSASGDSAAASAAAGTLEPLVAAGRMSELESLGARHAAAWATGRRDDAARLLRRLIELAGRADAQPVVLYQAVVPALMFGAGRDVDAGLRLLEICHRRGVLPQYDWLVRDSRLAPLRADPRFAPIRAAARAEFDMHLEVIENARRQGQWPAYLDDALAEVMKVAAER